MDGLEAVELKLSEVLIDNDSNRFDSEYFKKKYLGTLNKLYGFELKEIGNVSKVSDGDHSKFPDDQLEEVRYLQAKDIKDYFINDSSSVFVSKAYFDNQKRSHIFEENILVSIMGNVGDIAITPKGFKPCMANRAVAMIKEIKEFNPYYIFVFLISDISNLQLERLKNGGVQERINLEVLAKVKIPFLTVDFQIQMEHIVKLAYQKLEESKQLYKEAEDLLLSELGLLDFTSNNENIAIKSFADSFSVSGRLDSEYYQPKYDDIINKIKNYHNGYDLLHSACKLKDSNFNPLSELSYNYIELSDIGTTGEITGCTNDDGVNLPTRARRIVKANDVIISSVEGSIDKVALVQNSYNNSLCSTGFYVINSEQINSCTLLVLFKNKIFQQLLKQCCSGTILTAINKDEFLNIPVPLINKVIQEQIETKVNQSFILKEQSKQLLDLAKRAVEVAIEESEQSAMELINNAKY